MPRKHRRQERKFPLILLSTTLLFIIVIGICVYFKHHKINNNSKQVSTTAGISKVEPDITKKDEKNTDNIPEQGNVDNQSTTSPEDNKASETPTKQQPVKANESYIDPFMENYLNIYINLVNNSNLEFYYLDSMVQKNGSYYKIITDEIQKLRDTNTKCTLDSFNVDNITKGSTDSELIANVTQTISGKTNKYKYTIYFDKAGVFIKDRK
jgi:hypothetical protein